MPARVHRGRQTDRHADKTWSNTNCYKLPKIGSTTRGAVHAALSVGREGFQPLSLHLTTESHPRFYNTGSHVMVL